jgi:hypothetical protein
MTEVSRPQAVRLRSGDVVRVRRVRPRTIEEFLHENRELFR